MARIRTIKPEFFTSETLAALPIAVRMTFIGLWTHADDYGRLVDNSRIIKGAIWPLDDDVTPTDVSLHIHMLVECGKVARYEAGGKNYLVICGWHHQKINRKSDPKHPAPPWESTGSTDPSVRTQGVDSEEGVQEQGTGNREQGSLSSRSERALHEPHTRQRTEEERGLTCLKILAIRMGKGADKPDGYAFTFVKNGIQTPELVALLRAHPEDTDQQIVDRYQAGQTASHPANGRSAPQCAICQATSHTEANCLLREDPQ